METERKDTEPNVIQPSEYMDRECYERLLKSKANKTMDKWECHKQMQKQENSTMM